MLLLNFSFVMIYIICKMSLLLKNYPNYLKDNIFESFIKSIINIFFFLIFFFIIYKDEKSKA